jgi:hypothetical protein
MYFPRGDYRREAGILETFKDGEEPETFERDGVTYVRQHRQGRRTGHRSPSTDTIMPFVSYSLPKFWPYAPKHDAKGRCIFNSRREAEEACARARHAGEMVHYNPKQDLESDHDAGPD